MAGCSLCFPVWPLFRLILSSQFLYLFNFYFYSLLFFAFYFMILFKYTVHCLDVYIVYEMISLIFPLAPLIFKGPSPALLTWEVCVFFLGLLLSFLFDNQCTFSPQLRNICFSVKSAWCQRLFMCILKPDIRGIWLHTFLWQDFNSLSVCSSPRLFI